MIKIKETKNGSKYFVTNDGIIDNNLNLYDFDFNEFKKEGNMHKVSIILIWLFYQMLAVILKNRRKNTDLLKNLKKMQLYKKGGMKWK